MYAGGLVAPQERLGPTPVSARSIYLHRLEAEAMYIIRETVSVKLSERHGCLIDRDQAGSMELEKQQGYF